MDEVKKKELIGHLSDNLAMLRTSLGLTQAELSEKVGLSRHTLMAIENKQREMVWGTFLSLVLIFIKNKKTDKLLNVLEIYTDDLHEMLKGKNY
jgi:DNA-binding XRE family transcriptional regulator